MATESVICTSSQMFQDDQIKKRGAQNTQHLGETINVHTRVIGKPESNKRLAKSRSRRNDNIKTDLQRNRV